MAHIVMLKKFVTFSVHGYNKDYESQRVPRGVFLAILDQYNQLGLITPDSRPAHGIVIHKPGGLGITVYPDTSFGLID